MAKYFITYIVCCFFMIASTKAQISHGGDPLPFSVTKNPIEQLFISMPSPDWEEIQRIDSLEATDGLRSGYRFAYKFMTDYSPSNAGIHFTLPDGTKVWRLGIRSKGAYSISVLFSEYHLPKGARLFLYNREQTEIRGSFDHRNNSARHLLPTAPLLGEELIIEYQEPKDVAFPGRLVIGEINHGYRGFKFYEPQPDFPDFHCMPPIACYQDTTTRYHEIERSVVLLIINGVVTCTGTLVNNTANDGRPYLLTASHCLNNQFSIKNPDYEEIAGQVICFFNYNSPQCSPVEPGRTDQTVASAHFRAVNEQTDMALLELQEVPPTSYHAYYAGWNAKDAGSAPYTCIHHPGGSLKRMNRVDGGIKLTTYQVPGILFHDHAHWLVKKWETGCTAGGSSGSPLLDSNLRVLGGLTGGISQCHKPIQDFFFSLSCCWSTPADSSKQLQYWLDPIRTGERVCQGMDPNPKESHLESTSYSPDLKLYADTDNQTIHVDFSIPITQAQLFLYDAEGKIRKFFRLKEPQTILQVNDLPKGIYIMQVVYNNKLYTQKTLFKR